MTAQFDAESLWARYQEVRDQHGMPEAELLQRFLAQTRTPAEVKHLSGLHPTLVWDLVRDDYYRWSLGNYFAASDEAWSYAEPGRHKPITFINRAARRRQSRG